MLLIASDKSLNSGCKYFGPFFLAKFFQLMSDLMAAERGQPTSNQSIDFQ